MPIAERVSPAPELVTRVAALLGTDPARAKRDAAGLLATAPRDPRLLLILASAMRRLGDVDAALAVLRPLATAYPRAARTQYEFGLVLLETGDAVAGEVALRRAVAADPELGDAWRGLGDHLFRSGDHDGAEHAFAMQSRSLLGSPSLRRAADAMTAGRLVEAEDLLLADLRRDPSAAMAIQLLAETLLRQDRLNEAETLFRHCLMQDPDNDGVRFSLAMALFRRQAGAEALAEIETLLARDADLPAYRNLHAACLALIGRHDEALAQYERLLAQAPRHARIWLNYGHALRTIGRRTDAVAAYRRSVEHAPQLGEAYWALANLKTVKLQPVEVDAMTAELSNEKASDEDRLHLHYALGKSAEDDGDSERAFAHYAAGAMIRHGQQSYSASAASDACDRIKQVFDAALFRRGAGGGCPSEAPIFVVGLPRSGSTLVEQILASHSLVEGTLELPDIGVIAEGLRGRKIAGVACRYPDAALDLDGTARRDLGETYLARTAVHRTQGRAHFVDKMPNNFHHIGLIHLILPNARIIDVRRHPLAACFSAFKQLFASGHPYSYDLEELGRYYRDYVDLMRHFDAALPGRVHRVIYEDLVDDTEAQVRSLLAHCGLPFEQACLDFHENDRAVRTVSSEQVRQPIFRDGIDRWRSFDRHLDPVRRALGPVLADWRGQG